MAQCNPGDGAPPPPPAAAVTADFSNRTFGSPPNAFGVQNNGQGGCDGPKNLDPNAQAPFGGPGQQGGDVTLTGTNVRVVGGAPQGPADPVQSFYGAYIRSVGGNAGTGGEGNYAGGDGGIGGAGARGGNISVRLGIDLIPSPTFGAVPFGISLDASGGRGGNGGANDTSGVYAKVAGNGAAGGQGGSVQLIVSGSIQANLGIVATAYGGNGGAGGKSDSDDVADDKTGGSGGKGAEGGTVSVRLAGGTISTSSTAILALAEGGTGGAGGSTGPYFSTQGGDGGAGGGGGASAVGIDSGATVLVSKNPASLDYVDSSMIVRSIGGAGGAGGLPGGAPGQGGGSGGKGGDAGSATATVLGTVEFNGFTAIGRLNGPAILVQSNGGVGGPGAGIVGAIIGSPGGGGFAGAGGDATLTLGNNASAATVRTTGNFVHGALVQSVGGAGGNGGSASFLFGGGSGGAGAAGGDGGTVQVNGASGSRVVVKGDNATAIMAQSIGGGGGSGGDATDVTVGASYVVGGNGGLGGNGATVRVTLDAGVYASTSTKGGGGILAQSIGGSGGVGGSASASGVGLISMVVGGDAGNGSGSGGVTVNTGALITTYGDHAAGLQAQSIGGGGGKAGSALSFITTVGPSASVSVGGRGGSGGAAGEVQAVNTGQITTYGADAPGVLMQSIGGGGGSGGAAAARAVSLAVGKYIPAVSIAVATGGAGGSGNTGGKVSLTNSGLIATAGDAAFGVMAQSIGGGGGTGGDATGAAYSTGVLGTVSISVGVGVGGSGGKGGLGGEVDLANAGVVATLGHDAYGVVAQSIGGGGGMGGGGDATSSAGGAKAGLGATITVGGGGGGGNDGGRVSLLNTGAVTTVGDGADAVFAQSVGGGGGAGHGGVGTANGSKLAINVTLGGSGGGGGDGGKVLGRNYGSIVTRGTDAIGLSVQSVGGSGGRAGKAGSTTGGVSPASNADNLYNVLSKGLNFGQMSQDLGDGVIQIGSIGQQITATFNELSGVFNQVEAGPGSIGNVDQLSVGVAVGGRGGAAGAGGAVDAINTGNIGTFGAQSDGVFAQSVGGGGGKGGAATSTGKAGNDSTASTSVAVGGNGGGGGNGGRVTVTNETGNIRTQGVLAFAIAAQSIGGGGGNGATAGTVDGSVKSLGVGVGGNGGSGGSGGEVQVMTGNGSPEGGHIETSGKHGIGVLAQSVGAGGGVMRNMTTDQTFDPAKILNNPQGRLGDIQGYSFSLGGQNGIGGNGGVVGVQVESSIETSGRDAHGVVVQSIGGGGGLIAGGQALAPKTGGSSGAGGSGGYVTVELTSGARIATGASGASFGGDGAYGILAQSIGGGGGVAGDLSNAPRSIGGVGAGSGIQSSNGDGGFVNIGLQDSSVSTVGSHAHGIFAQSIGGGGGLVNQVIGTNADGSSIVTTSRGSAGGGGNGGRISIELVNSSVSASGAGSAGILAQSDGGSRGPIVISIDAKSSVLGGAPDPAAGNQPARERDAAAIRFLGGSANQLINYGTVAAANNGYALIADGPRDNIIVTNVGKLTGSVSFGGGAGNVLDNRAGGVLDAPETLDLNGGLLRNAGTLRLGGVGTTGPTTLTGDLIQTPDGTILVDAAASAASGNRIVVKGHATLSGVVVPVVSGAASLKPGSTQATFLTATDGVVQDGVRVSLAGTPVARYALATPDGNTLALRYTVDYSASDVLRASGVASPNRGEVGRALNQILSGDAPGFSVLASRLATVTTADGVASLLDVLSGEVAASVQQTSFAAQQAFATTLLRHAVGRGTGASQAASYAEASLDPVAGPPLNQDGVRVWVGGFGASDVLRGTAGQGSLHSQTAGGLLGLDKWFDADRMLGISVGGGTIDFNVTNRASQGHSAAFNVGLYGLAQFGDAYVSAALAYGNYAATLRRTGLSGIDGLAATGRGSLSNDVLGGRAELGWRRQLGSVSLTPFASLQVDHLWQGSFTEGPAGQGNAGALALQFGRAERTSVPLTIGGRVGGGIPVGAGRVLALSAELGWVHEFNPQRSVTAAFVAATAVPFRVLGVSASRDAAQTSLDAKLPIDRNIALLGSFTGRFSGVETAIGGTGGLQITW